MLGSAGTHLVVSPLRTPADVRTPAVWAENDAFPVIAPSSLPCIMRDRPQRARNVREGDGAVVRCGVQHHRAVVATVHPYYEQRPAAQE